MRPVKALVVAVNRPGFNSRVKGQPLAASPDTWQVTVTWMSKPYEFQCKQTGEIVKVRPKKRKSIVFTNYLPELHSWIEVKFA
jgi:hypothetical protein